MKKIVRLTESDLTRLVKRVIEETKYEDYENPMSMEPPLSVVLDDIKNIGGGESGMKKLVDLQTRMEMMSMNPTKKRKIMRAIDKKLEVITSQDWSKY